MSPGEPFSANPKPCRPTQFRPACPVMDLTRFWLASPRQVDIRKRQYCRQGAEASIRPPRAVPGDLRGWREPRSKECSRYYRRAQAFPGELKQPVIGADPDLPLLSSIHHAHEIIGQAVLRGKRLERCHRDTESGLRLPCQSRERCRGSTIRQKTLLSLKAGVFSRSKVRNALRRSAAARRSCRSTDIGRRLRKRLNRLLREAVLQLPGRCDVGKVAGTASASTRESRKAASNSATEPGRTRTKHGALRLGPREPGQHEMQRAVRSTWRVVPRFLCREPVPRIPGPRILARICATSA